MKQLPLFHPFLFRFVSSYFPLPPRRSGLDFCHAPLNRCAHTFCLSALRGAAQKDPYFPWAPRSWGFEPRGPWTRLCARPAASDSSFGRSRNCGSAWLTRLWGATVDGARRPVSEAHQRLRGPAAPGGIVCAPPSC